MSDQTIRYSEEAHQRYIQAAKEAAVWLAEQIRSRGCKVGAGNEITVDGSCVSSCRTIKPDTVDARKVTAFVSITPNYRKNRNYWSQPVGLKVKVHRDFRPVTYHSKDICWQRLPWQKIIDMHLAELDALCRSHEIRISAKSRQELLRKLADQEVPALIDKSFANSFERSRFDDGTYRISLSLTGITKEQALQLRQLAESVISRNAKNA